MPGASELDAALGTTSASREALAALALRWRSADPSAVFDSRLVPLAVATEAVPAIEAMSEEGTLLVRPDGEVLLVRGALPHASAPVTARSQRDRDKAYVALAARHPELAALAPKRPPDARTCKACKGSGRTRSKANPRFEVPGVGTFCHACIGKGFCRNPLSAHRNALQGLFAEVWTTWGLGAAIANDPRPALAARGLDLPAFVEVEATMDVPCCPYCQLNVQRVHVVVSEPSSAPLRVAGARAPDPLAAWFLRVWQDPTFRESALSDGRRSFEDAGLDLTDNVLVTVERGMPHESPSIWLDLGEAAHVCCCDEHELWDVLAPENCKNMAP
jgi:hypothetical protein